MKGNKPHTRYQIIDQKLSRNRRITWEELAEACQRELDLPQPPSKSTILHDLGFLRSKHGARIGNKQGVYFYEEKNFSIFNSPLDSGEVKNLQELRSMLRQMAKLPTFRQFDEILLQLEQYAGLPSAADADSFSPAPISFERLDIARGFEHLRDLYRAILGRRVLLLFYKKFDADVATEVRFHPWFLKEYNHRWSLFGWDETDKKMKTYSLDRIEKIKNASGSYRPSDFDFEKYFSVRVGVWQESADEKLEIVRLRLSPDRAPYLETKPLHHSQKLVEKSADGWEFEFELVVNRQLEGRILEFGCAVEVLAPAGLRQQVFENLQQALRTYQTSEG